MAGIPKKVVAMAEIPKKGGRYGWKYFWKKWLLWLKFMKNVVAMAEIPKKAYCCNWNSFKNGSYGSNNYSFDFKNIVNSMTEIPKKNGRYGWNS